MKIKKMIEVEIEVHDNDYNGCSVYCKYYIVNPQYMCSLFIKEIDDDYNRVRECLKQFGVDNENKI